MKCDLTILSSKGQIVIPGGIRKRLNLNEGDTFALYEHKTLLVLKKLGHALEQQDISALHELEQRLASSVNRDIPSAQRAYIQ